LEYARQSLALLPGNPLLLVAVADVQAQQSQDDSCTKLPEAGRNQTSSSSESRELAAKCATVHRPATSRP
jgi:hypothetical protein